MITSVDEASRHEDLPNLQAAHDRDKKALETQRDADIAAISREVEQELARIEADGGKAAEKRSCVRTLNVRWLRPVSVLTARLSTWRRCGTASRT